MWWIILWILSFILLVILHELWHFTAAKKSWVHVKEFWLWLPPKITTLWKDKSWTEYTLNWIPLWGFVSLKWEDWTNEKENKDKDSFVRAKMWKKLIIVLAWVAMNFFTAWVIFTIALSIWMKPMSILPDDVQWIHSESYFMPSMSFIKELWFLSWSIEEHSVEISQVISWSIAEWLGFSSWTVILDINWESINSTSLTEILNKLENTENNTIKFKNWEEGEEYETSFSCWSPCKLWIVYQQYWNFEALPIKYWLGQAMIASAKEIRAERNLTMASLWMIGEKLFSFKSWESKEVLNSLTWPVGIVKLWESLWEYAWFLTFLWFVWMLSIALWIFNVLPIPALDGWRFWAIIIQKVFRIKEEKFSIVEGWVNTVFFRFLMLVWILIILKDLAVWWGVHIPFFS